MPRMLKLHFPMTNENRRHKFLGQKYHLMTHFPMWCEDSVAVPSYHFFLSTYSYLLLNMSHCFNLDKFLMEKAKGNCLCCLKWHEIPQAFVFLLTQRCFTNRYSDCWNGTEMKCRVETGIKEER